MHEGHRKRMYAKLESGENLYDHEILEILLYNAFPRVNTNPIAHALLERFTSLAEIFKADVEELKSVDGVGEQAAYYLRCVGLCAERAGRIEGVAKLKNFGECKQFVKLRMHGREEEFLEMYYMEANGRIKRIFTYTDSDPNRVSASFDGIVRNIALVKPKGMLIAHNHLTGGSRPSGNDETFTREMAMICAMNNVRLWDHIIYASDDDIFSYNDSGLLDGIRGKCSLDSVVKWIKNLN